MIISGILYFLYWIVLLLMSPILLLADVTLEAGAGLAITSAMAYIANFNDILPLLTLFEIIGIILGIEVIVAGYKIIMWILRRLPTQS